ncbi:MAG TPA: hypothetical protein VK722_06030 [Candidatus Aquilonibacter sp.]|jgi:hypothetical protein|nr:hypothetical protein [Candidatus Aquilonibacter sp.]
MSLRVRWLDDPLVLLCLVAGLLAFVVQSGELGSADTMYRLKTTHWLWTGEPQVAANDFPEFGLRGRGGRLYSWYGIGQSLLMLPADLVGTWISHWKIFSEYEDDPAVRAIVVAYSTSILVNVLTVLAGFRLLRQLRFSMRETVLGLLALLFCTTHLHYTQNMMENNYIMLLTLVGFSFQYEWLRTGNRRALFWGCAALGLNLLTRLTTVLDLIAAGIFLLLVFLFQGESASEIWRRFAAYCKVTLPVYVGFLLIERWYSYYRFGSFTRTYLPLFASQLRSEDPTLPANFPWSTPFHEGFFGAFFKPEKSILLFDPLIILAIVVLVVSWKYLSAEVRAYGAASLLLLVGYISFYACYTYWTGDFAWGDRYVSTAVEMVALLAVPLLLRMREKSAEESIPQGLKPLSIDAAIGTAEAVPFPVLSNPKFMNAVVVRWVWRGGIALIVVSLVVQVASLAFWLPLEIYQMETLGHPTFVIALRFKNIAAFALGKMDAWGLVDDAMKEDPWDYVHITTWNFFPFLLRRVGAAPGWVVNMTFAVWGGAIAALGLSLLRLRRVVLRNAAI